MLKKFFPNQRIDPKNCFLLGHSMGALISLLWIVRAEPDTFPFQRSFISSPPLVLSLPIPQWKSTLSKLTYRLTPYLSVPNGISSSWLSHDEAVVLAYDQDPLTHSYSSPALHETMLEASIEVREKHGKVESPIFLIVGEKDPIVSPQAIQVFYEQLSTHRKIVRYPNFLHECFNELGREKVWKDLLEWISQKN